MNKFHDKWSDILALPLASHVAYAVHSCVKQVVVILCDEAGELAVIVVNVGHPVYLARVAQVIHPLHRRDMCHGAIGHAFEIENSISIGLQDWVDPDRALTLTLKGVADVAVALKSLS